MAQLFGMAQENGSLRNVFRSARGEGTVKFDGTGSGRPLPFGKAGRRADILIANGGKGGVDSFSLRGNVPGSVAQERAIGREFWPPEDLT